MKHSLLPIAIISLAFTGCSLIRPVPDVTPPTETPAIIAPQEETPTVVVSEENRKTGADIKTPNTNKTPTIPAGNTPKTTVSTEDLTKELDSFVDDITKGL